MARSAVGAQGTLRVPLAPGYSGTGAAAAAAGRAGATRAQGHAESPSPLTDRGSVDFSVQVLSAFGIQHQLRHLLGA